MTRPNLGKLTFEQVQSLRQGGATYKQISREAGCSYTAVCRYVNRHLPELTGDVNRRKLSIAEIRQLRQEGLSYEQIAPRVGVSEATVRAFVHKRLPELSSRQKRTFRTTLAARDDGTRSLEEVAEEVGCSANTVRVYRWRRRRNAVERCIRCSILEAPDEPLNAEGLCLDCSWSLNGDGRPLHHLLAEL